MGKPSRSPTKDDGEHKETTIRDEFMRNRGAPKLTSLDEDRWI